MRRSLVSLAASLCLSALVLTGCGGSSATPSTTSSTTPPPAGGSGSSTGNPAPSISGITPGSVVAGSAAQTLTVTGTGFIASSVVNLNTTALATTYVNATTLTASAPASALAAGQADTVTVTNPAPGGGSSPASAFNITSPTPAVSSIAPQSVPQGTAATITVTGTGFEANSQALWNGAARTTTFVSSTSVKIALTTADVAMYGTGQITVNNPGPGGSATTPVDLAIVANTPVITSVSPSSVAVNTSGTVPTQVFLSGSDFASGATVLANGKAATVLSESASAITLSLPASDFTATGTIQLVESNPGSPAVSSNTATLAVISPNSAFTLNPTSAPAGSPDITVTINGQGFFADSVVQWNGTPLKTTYSSSNGLTAVIPASLLAGFANASIGVSTPENAGANPPTQPFTTYLALPVNDIVWNATDSLIYASVPGIGGPNLGNSIVGIDPNTGVIQKTIFVGSNPNRIALSTDGTQLFVGLDGAGAVRQVNLTTATAGVQFSLGGGPGVYNLPYTASALAALPGEPNSVAVYGTNGVVTVFDGGVARPDTSSGLQVYFTDNYGALAFGSSASTLYLSDNGAGSYLYALAIGASGITGDVQSKNAPVGGTTLQYDNGRLYENNGDVLSATDGDQLGQFSQSVSYSTTPVAITGPVYSDSTLNRAWVLPSGISSSNQILSFDETTFDPVASLPISGVGAGSTYPQSSLADLIRWGQDGLAFHTGNQLFAVQGAFVKDTSASPADLSVTVQAPAAATTGTAMTYTFTVANQGPNSAQGVVLTASLPGSVIFSSAKASRGACSGSGELYCDLGALSNAASATVQVTVTPSTSGTAEATAAVDAQTYDPVAGNNQATGSTTVSGNLFSPLPVVTQIAPALVAAGSDTFTLTVNGDGFTGASSVLWNGTSLPTTVVSSGQLTATVDASLIKSLGWSQVSVSSASPGGGQSSALTFSIYQLLSVPANAIAFDPFTRMLYAVLPSTAQGITGNSIVAVDPASASVGTPVVIGSEPNLLSETSDGNYMYVGLSGAKSIGRFNLLSQSLDLTVALPTNATYTTGDVPAIAIAAVPGTDSSLAVESDSFNGIGIFDISGSTGAFRKNSSSAYSGDNPVFSDSTHFYAYDSSTTGAEFYRYTINADGVSLVDGTSLNGFGGFSGEFAVDGPLVYGAAGGIINPASTPPSQVALLPLGAGPYGTGLVGGGAVPYAAESKDFLVGVNDAGTALDFLQRFDTQHYVLEQQLQLPSAAVSGLPGTRWGQDGLAYMIPGTGSNAAPQLFLLRGPFVLPAEANSNPIPALASAGSSLAKASGNQYLTITGSGFLPGATVLWNGSARTTNYVDAQHLSVAIAAADVQTAASIKITAQNPGSGVSNTLSLSVQ